MRLRFLAVVLMLALMPAGAVPRHLAHVDAGPTDAPIADADFAALLETASASFGKDVKCEIGPTRPAAVAHHGSAGSTAAATVQPRAHAAHASPAGPARADSSTPEHAHAAPSASEMVVHASHADGCQPSPDQEAAAKQLVENVRAVLTKRFDLPEKAVLEGYRRGPNESPQNIHYFDPEEQASPAILDPNHPEGVVYRERQVIGAVFMMQDQGQKGPQPGGCLMQWHSHWDEKAKDFSPEAIHVWIVDRPGGTFGH